MKKTELQNWIWTIENDCGMNDYIHKTKIHWNIENGIYVYKRTPRTQLAFFEPTKQEL